MNKELPQNPRNSDEVDLGQLFKLLGKMFKSLFNFIGSIFNKIFLAFVWFVFFIKKHILKILIAGIIGFVTGYFKESIGQTIYKSTTVIKQNYKTGENLYRAIAYYNELIEEEDFITLGTSLGIGSKEATALIELDIKSISTLNENLKSYDDYTKSLDSSNAKTMTFDDYVKNYREFQYPVQRIIIKATEKGVFLNIIPQIVEKISKTEYFINERQKDLDELYILEKSLSASIKESKALQDVYKKVLEKPLQNNGGAQTSISIDNTKDNNVTREYDLYLNDIILKRELVKIQREINDKRNIVDIVSSQENQGSVYNSKEIFGQTLNMKLYYALVLMALVSMILLGISFINFLERYKDKI